MTAVVAITVEVEEVARIKEVAEAAAVEVVAITVEVEEVARIKEVAEMEQQQGEATLLEVAVPVIPKTGYPQSVPVSSDGTCFLGGVHIANVKHSCIYEKQGRDPDGTCPTGYVITNADPNNPCSIRIHDPLKDGTCPIGYSHMAITQLCKINADTSSGLQVDELPAGYCAMGYTHMGTKCVIE